LTPWIDRFTLGVINRTLCVLIVAVSSVGAACGGGDDGADGGTIATTDPPTGSTTVPTTDDGVDDTIAPTIPPIPTTPPVTDQPPTTQPPPTVPPPPTFPTVTSEVVGTAVGGNSGGEGEGQTNTFSETIRNPDGTCSGWDGPGGLWTQGLLSGAPVVFLAADSDTQIGTGQLGTSSWKNVSLTGSEQWNCTFPFSGEVEGTPDRFRIKVADLEPWTVRFDPTAPGTFVASVNTVARFDVFGACTDPIDVTEVSEWSVVGEYWSNGIPTLCDRGLSVVGIERPCRPVGFGSDYIVSVTSADDPSVVFESPDGLLVDPAGLAPLTPVVVHVTTGQPC
jgi:hypothetical protein